MRNSHGTQTFQAQRDPTYAVIEAMVAQSGLNATTQEKVVNYSKLFMKAFLERAMQGEMNHFLKEEVRQTRA